ncbi:hypothetical protein MBLNU459_g4912t1 [Dothideomycetes sp. NU459]
MSDPIDIPQPAPGPAALDAAHSSASTNNSPPNADYLTSSDALRSSGPSGLSSTPSTPGGYLSRTMSHASFSDQDDEGFPPLDRLTMFDILENLALPQRLERIQSSISAQTEKVRRQQQKLKSSGLTAKDKMVEEWRKRVPTPDEQLEKYKKRMRENVDRLGRRWSDDKSVTMREKMSFIAGVLNIFLSGYFIGAFPEYFHYWYTAQLAYFMPIRYYTYHKIGYHYFLADLCYFVNLLMLLSIWFFPNSKRLFISTYCLAFGNNAVAIAMWRNSLVFHSLDKVTSLFIHIMPCATLHCIVHLLPPDIQRVKFPAIYSIRFSPVDSPEHYTLGAMIVWATVPYAVWQLSYHFLITVRRREKIAAGRPTSFTWLRKSYAKNPLGRAVLSLPDSLQEPAFMGIQYAYALLTMIPCPIWFYYRWASATFLMVVFTWATYNGATFYIDVFGKKMEKELYALKKEVAKWQATPEGRTIVDGSPSVNKFAGSVSGGGTPSAQADAGHKRSQSLEDIPLLDQKEGTTSREEHPETAEAVRKRETSNTVA